MPESRPCASCEWRKSKNNKNKGRLIPGQGGKCVRPEGLCDPAPKREQETSEGQ